MRVLLLAHSYPRFTMDPVGSFVLRLATALRDEGIDARVVAPGGPGLAPTEEFEGIRVDRFRYSLARWETLAYTGAMRSQVRESWSARAAMAGFLGSALIATLRAVRRHGAELVHAHWWFPAGITASAVCALTRLPLVTTLHGSDLRVAQGGPAARRLFAHVVRRSHALTTVSHWLAEETRRLVPAASPLVAPMPIAAAVFPPREQLVRNSLLFVGKLNEQKGIAPLLRALAMMRQRPTLDIVVGVGSDEGPTRRLAAELGVADRLRWFPLLDQAALAERYRRSTALVVPAIDEGLGMTAIEALLSGTPVVAFASGGLTDSVVHGRTGYLVPPGDEKALAFALDRLLDLPDQGSALGAAGREHALAHFSPVAVARQYASIYREARARARS